MVTKLFPKADHQFYMVHPYLTLLSNPNLCRWVNRKDPSGSNIFSGGFLGLEYQLLFIHEYFVSLPSNIGVFDRSKPLPDGGALKQVHSRWFATSFLHETVRRYQLGGFCVSIHAQDLPWACLKGLSTLLLLCSFAKQARCLLPTKIWLQRCNCGSFSMQMFMR